MKAGVGRSPSPNHRGTTAGSPSADIATWPILENGIAATTGRTPAGRAAEASAPSAAPFIAERGFGLLADLVERDAGRRLYERHAVIALLVDGEDAEIGDHHVDDMRARERQRAAMQQLLLVFRRVLHHHHDLLHPRDEVHSAAHPLHHLAWDHPIGEIAILRHLHRAKDGKIDMAAAHHGEAVGAGEVARGRKLGDGLLAGVDEIGVFFALIGKGTHAEHAVLALELHAHSRRYVVRHERRDADAEIDIEAVAQLFGRARRHLFTSPRHGYCLLLSALARGALLDAFQRVLHMHDALHEDPR